MECIYTSKLSQHLLPIQVLDIAKSLYNFDIVLVKNLSTIIAKKRLLQGFYWSISTLNTVTGAALVTRNVASTSTRLFYQNFASVPTKEEHLPLGPLSENCSKYVI